MHRVFRFVFLFAVILLFSCSTKNDCVMKIGSQTLYYPEARELYSKSQAGRSSKAITEEDAKAFCELYYAREMFYLEEAKTLSVEEEDSIRTKILDYRKQLLTYDGGPLYNRIISGIQAPTEEQLLQMYQKRQWEYKIAHILLPSRPLADSLYQEIKAGADFTQAARRLSFDRRWGDSSGVWFDWFLYGSMGGDFDDLVISLSAGNVAGPVHTRYGYHIIRLINKREHSQLPYEKERVWIENAYKSMENVRTMFQYKEGLLSEYKPKTDLQAIRRIRQAFSENDKRLPDLEAASLNAGQLAMPLVTYHGGTFTLGDFVRFYQSQRPLLRPPLTRLDAIEELSRQAATRDLMYLKAVEMGFEKEPDFQNKFEQYRRNLLVSECRQRLFEPYEISDQEIRRRYDADSTYQFQPFDLAGKWVRRAINTEKLNAENARQLQYLKAKYQVEFCHSGLKKLVAAMNESRQTPSSER
jgi:peptidyl-prolyl cis-trans isomerase C